MKLSNIHKKIGFFSANKHFKVNPNDKWAFYIIDIEFLVICIYIFSFSVIA